jgi:hypothetical protein
MFVVEMLLRSGRRAAQLMAAQGNPRKTGASSS